jgi:DNA-binding CsgD family transcriptional regulator
MGRDRPRARCRERLQLIAGSTLGADDLRAEVLETLRRAIGFSTSCWQLADPATLLPTTHHMGERGVPFEQCVPRLTAMDQGRGLGSSRSLFTGRPVATMSAATGGDLARSPIWRECLGPAGMGDVFRVAGRDRFGAWGWINATRDRGEAPFDQEDVRLLADISASLGAVMRRSVVARESQPQLTPPAPGIVILDDEPRETSWTPEAHQWLELLPDAAEWSRLGQLPTALYGIAGRLLADPDGTVPGAARARVRTTTGNWAVLDGGQLEGDGAGRIAITIRAATADEALDILCRAHGLTRRESELVGLVVHGLSTQQIAERLYITPYTVKDHLKAIFEKTGVSSRGELVHRVTSAGA